MSRATSLKKQYLILNDLNGSAPYDRDQFASRADYRRHMRERVKTIGSHVKNVERKEAQRDLVRRQKDTPQTMRLAAMMAESVLSRSTFC